MPAIYFKLPLDLILPTHSEVLRRFVQVARFSLRSSHGSSCVSNGFYSQLIFLLKSFIATSFKLSQSFKISIIQIYYLIINALMEPKSVFETRKFLSRWRGTIPRLSHYKCDALPTELHRR